MQIRIKSLFLILLMFSVLSSCQINDDDGNLPADSCIITANVDGTDFRWELGSCSYTNQTLTVGDLAKDDEAEMSLEPVRGTGVFISGDPDVTIGIFLTLGPGQQIFDADVRIEVVSFSNTEISGTFEGFFTDIGGSSYQVANGMFRATLP